MEFSKVVMLSTGIVIFIDHICYTRVDNIEHKIFIKFDSGEELVLVKGIDFTHDDVLQVQKIGLVKSEFWKEN